MRLFSDFASSTLAVTASPTDTTLFVQAGGGANFPAPTGDGYAVLTLEDSSGNREHVRLTARSSDTLTVVRGQDGTVPQSFEIGDRVELRATASAFELFIQLGNKTPWLDGANDNFPVRLVDAGSSEVFFSIDGLGRLSLGDVAEVQTPNSSGVISTPAGAVYTVSPIGTVTPAFRTFQSGVLTSSLTSEGLHIYGDLAGGGPLAVPSFGASTSGVVIDPNGTVHVQAPEVLERDVFVAHWGDEVRLKIDNYGSVVSGSIGKTYPPLSPTTKGVVMAQVGALFVQCAEGLEQPTFYSYNGDELTFSVDSLGRVSIGPIAEEETLESSGVILTPAGAVITQAPVGERKTAQLCLMGNTITSTVTSDGYAFYGETHSLAPSTPVSYPLPADTKGVVLDPEGCLVAQAETNEQSQLVLQLYRGSTLAYSINSQGLVGGASDARLKTNISDAAACLERVLQVTVREFEWKGAEGSPQLGLIAQELRPHFPELVTEVADGTLQVLHSQLPFILMKAMQELAARVESVEDRLAALEAKA